MKIPKGLFDQHIIALGKTRSGKSSKLRVYVEHLLKAGEPVCILDVKGEWWGMKSSADGLSPGFPLVIFGGKHADLPLNSGAGKELAEVIFTGNRPCIIDMKAMGMAERSRFFIDFTSRGFQVNQGKRYLAITEVHNFAFKGKVFSPQAGEMLHWANKLAAEGLGIGINLLADSQRGQKVHNDFLTSMETLIACKVIYKADRDAIKDWIDGCADMTIGKEVVDSLAQLKKPQAWVWCPEIEFGPELVEFPMFKTYDSFKPQKADAPAQLAGWASVDLAELEGRLTVVVEEAKASDPKVLKARIRELEAVIKGTSVGHTAQEIGAAHDEGYQEGYDAGRKDDDLSNAEHYRDGWDKGWGAAEKAANVRALNVGAGCIDAMRSQFEDLVGRLEIHFEQSQQPLHRTDPPALERMPEKRIPQNLARPLAERLVPKVGNKLIPAARATRAVADGFGLAQVKREGAMFINGEERDPSIPPLQHRILDALAELDQLGARQPTRVLVAQMVGYQDPTTKSFRNALAAMSSEQLIEYPSPGQVSITMAGSIFAKPPERPRTDSEHQARIFNMLGGERMREIVEPLLSAYPKAVAKKELATYVGYADPTTKSFRNTLARLRTLGFIYYPSDGHVAATAQMFL